MAYGISLSFCLIFTVCNLIEYISCQDGEIAETHAIDYESDDVGTDLDGMKQLFNDTLNGYDSRIRPRLDQSHIVEVITSFIPQSLLEFDTSEQKFSILGYFRVRWIDEVMVWNPEDYANTNYIKVPLSEVWRPSLIILKAFDGDGIVGNTNTDITKISSEGTVQWVPEGIYSVVCHVNIKYYPFDEQTCTITYYVTDETITTVELDHPEDVNLDEFTENSAWRVTSITRTRYLKYNTYHIDIKFKLQRRANFATFTLIMPLLMLAFLNICMLLVPIGSGEKGSFAITIFLSYGIFVTIVSDTLPDNSLQISFFLLFIIVLLFISVLSVLYTIVQAKLIASIGDKECTVYCLRPKRFSKKKVSPLQNELTGCEGDPCKTPGGYVVDLDEKESDETYTWGMFLERLDVIIFFIFFAIILLSTAGFFSLMLQRINESTLNEI